MANTAMDLLGWLRKQLEEADADLLREMMRLMAGMLMDAEVFAVCGAEYRERSGERPNSLNGHLHPLLAPASRRLSFLSVLPKTLAGSPPVIPRLHSPVI
mgnify:CR=1 FL=1